MPVSEAEIKTEAMLLARSVVKLNIRKEGHKVSDLNPRDITRLAQVLIKEAPVLMSLAEHNCIERRMKA